MNDDRASVVHNCLCACKQPLWAITADIAHLQMVRRLQRKGRVSMLLYLQISQTVEMVRLASHAQVQQQTVEHVRSNFRVTVEVVSFAPHAQVQQQTTPVPLIEHVTSSVNEFIATTPSVNFFTPNQQFPAYTMPLSLVVLVLTSPVLCTRHVLSLMWKPLFLMSLVHFLLLVSFHACPPGTDHYRTSKCTTAHR